MQYALIALVLSAASPIVSGMPINSAGQADIQSASSIAAGLEQALTPPPVLVRRVEKPPAAMDNRRGTQLRKNSKVLGEQRSGARPVDQEAVDAARNTHPALRGPEERRIVSQNRQPSTFTPPTANVDTVMDMNAQKWAKQGEAMPENGAWDRLYDMKHPQQPAASQSQPQEQLSRGEIGTPKNEDGPNDDPTKGDIGIYYNPHVQSRPESS